GHLRLPGGEQLGRVTTEGARNGSALPAGCKPAPPTHARREASAESGSQVASAAPASSFATIDINLACPVKKVKSKARGGHWLAEPDGAIAMLETVRAALPAEMPVTVKMRRAFDDTPEMVENFYRIFDAAYDMGCAW